MILLLAMLVASAWGAWHILKLPLWTQRPLKAAAARSLGHFIMAVTPSLVVAGYTTYADATFDTDDYYIYSEDPLAGKQWTLDWTAVAASFFGWLTILIALAVAIALGALVVRLVFRVLIRLAGGPV